MIAEIRTQERAKYYLVNQSNQFGHELCLLASVREQVSICFEEAYDSVKWKQVFDLCREKLSNTESHDLYPFLPMATADDFLSSQKPLAASQQVLASSQNNFLSLHLNEHRPSWSFK